MKNESLKPKFSSFKKITFCFERLCFAVKDALRLVRRRGFHRLNDDPNVLCPLKMLCAFALLGVEYYCLTSL